jgi:hypothetical protein
MEVQMKSRAVAVVLVLGSFALVSVGADSCSTGGGGGSGGGGSNGSGGNQSEQPAAEQDPELTSGQENALASAEQYLDLGGFSEEGLKQQLSSPAGEGYSEADATYAVTHVDADWNAEAVEAAEAYLEISPMSKAALIDQLSSSAGDNFTPEQAQYAADKVY